MSKKVNPLWKVDTCPVWLTVAYEPTDVDKRMVQWKEWLSPEYEWKDPSRQELKELLHWAASYEDMNKINREKNECFYTCYEYHPHLDRYSQDDDRRNREKLSLWRIGEITGYNNIIRACMFFDLLLVEPSPYVKFISLEEKTEEEAQRLAFWRQFIVQLVDDLMSYGAADKVVWCNYPQDAKAWLADNQRKATSLPARIDHRVHFLAKHWTKHTLTADDINVCFRHRCLVDRYHHWAENEIAESESTLTLSGFTWLFINPRNKNTTQEGGKSAALINAERFFTR